MGPEDSNHHVFYQSGERKYYFVGFTGTTPIRGRFSLQKKRAFQFPTLQTARVVYLETPAHNRGQAGSRKGGTMIFEDELTDDFFKETVQRVSEVFAEFGKRESSKTFSEEEKQQLIAAARKVLENCEKE